MMCPPSIILPDREEVLKGSEESIRRTKAWTAPTGKSETMILLNYNYSSLILL